jgi:FMN-dependent NADH-azoreductase
MPRLLYIEASPRKARSGSSAIAQAFLQAYREANSGLFVDQIDLWGKALPEFDQGMLEAKYAVMSGQSFTAAQKSSWASIEQMTDRFKAADLLLISTPMWNFGLPYKLKHYLDLIMQPGLTFGFDPARGYFGLVTNKTAVCVYSSAGDYPTGSPAEQIDFQRRYLRFALTHMGISNQHELNLAPTATEAQSLESLKAKLMQNAVELANSLFCLGKSGDTNLSESA